MIPRLLAGSLSAAFAQFPVVVLGGARQVGKTTLARALLPQAAYVTLDDPARAAAARLSPSAFLSGLSRPAIVDEVQYAPELFRHLKMAVDADRRAGSFFVTGSQTFSLMAGVSDSLAGRAAIFTLPTLTLTEVPGADAAGVDRFLWRSGFPELWQRPELDRDLWLGSYVSTYLERDVRQVLQVGDLRDFDRFVRAAALRAGQLLSYADLARDVGIAPNTAKRWLSVLEASHQVFLLEPYHRQRTKRLIKAPKVYFADTGLLCHLLGFHALADLQAHPMWGAVWENFVAAEVRKRLLDTGARPSLWFWRTAGGDEVDLLVEHGPERFAVIEAKVTAHPDATSLKGIHALTQEYGPEAVRFARVVCRTDSAYPLDSRSAARAVPLPDALDELAAPP
jgi:predicted AAA+ superfamily ATPase